MVLAWFVTMMGWMIQAQDIVVYQDVVIWQAPKPPQPHMTVIVADNIIETVGPASNVPLPPGSRMGAPPGAWLTLGLIDGFSRLGMCGLFDPTTPHDQPPGGTHIHPNQRAADGWDTHHPMLDAALREGIVAALVAPYGPLIQGQADWLQLTHRGQSIDPPAPSRILTATVHQGMARQLGMTKAQLWSQLRRILQESKGWVERPQMHQERQTKDWAIPVHQLLGLESLWRDQGILVLSVEHHDDIQRAIALQKTFGFALVLHGAYGAARLASPLAKANIPVMVQPSLLLPTSLEREEVTIHLPQQLHAAGVPLLFTAGGGMCFEHTRLRQEAALAVARGLSEDVALAAITSQPRTVLRYEAHNTQAIVPKRPAHFVVWSGHPFDLRHSVQTIWSEGEQQPLLSVRQMHQANAPTGMDLACSLRAGECP